MDAEQKVPPKPKRVATTTTVRIPFEKKRWRFTRNGRDFGPFPGSGIQARIETRELDIHTVLYEEWEGRSINIADVPEFSRVLEEVRRQIEQEQLEASTAETREAVQTSSRRRLLTGTAVLSGGAAAILIAIQFMLDAPVAPPSSLARSLFDAAPLTAIETVHVKPLPEIADRPENPQKGSVDNPKRVKRSSKGKRPASIASGKTVSTQRGYLIYGSSAGLSLSFDEEGSDASNAGPLFNSRNVTRKVSQQLSRCMKTEANIRTEFKGGDVTFTLAGSGKVVNVKLSRAGNVTTGLISCIKSVFTKTKFAAFSGGNQIVKIPVRIQSTSN